MRLTFAVAVLSALISCSPPAAQLQDGGASQPIELRVMTFNIRAGNGDLDGIARVIRDAAPDIVGLQEVDVHFSSRSGFVDQASTLAGALEMEVRFAHIYELEPDSAGRPPRRYGVAMLSRYPVLEFRNHELHRLSTVEEEPAPRPRTGFLEAILDVEGTRVRFFNTHLDYRPDPALRTTQVEETLAILGETRMPTLLIGDLNARPDAAELQPLLAFLHDAWRDQPAPGHTFPSDAPDRRIDYILHSDHFEVQRVEVLETTASDHRPVVADLVMTHVE
ncbi:MAG: metal-dependent hydrolase [Candidatus Cloacimonetes bacterium]|jgi:endonuclease/exonuclease/phosphatase family metal-dependent hydrolase|nr:metal-dependent hydrolase [Candidatus Cloacimonadota bacterium]